MALSHLLRLKSSLQICRISFAAARIRCCTSVCSSSDNDNPPFVAEPLETTPVLFSADGGSNKRKKLTDLFRNQKNDQESTMTKNEEETPMETLSDALLNITKYRSTQFELLSQSNDLVPNEPLDNSEDDHLSNKCENNPPDHENVMDEGGDVSNTIRSVLNSKDNYMESENDQPEEEIVKRRSLTFTHEPLEHSKEPCMEDGQNQYDITSLIGIMGMQLDLQSKTISVSSNGGPIGEKSLNDSMQRFDNDDKLNSPSLNSNNEDKKTSVLDFKSIDSTDSKSRVKVSVPKTNKDQKQLKDPLFAKEELEENKVIVWFLPSEVTEKNLIEHFSYCGEILKVEVELPSAGGQLYKNGYVYFKTREGLHRALKRSRLYSNRVFLIVETTEKMTLKIPVPCLIGDPDIPSALVKNPTRTVKIEGLSHEINSHHIEKALTFCGSNISGYFLGSSHSVAYVEFETEIGKERALRKQSINVLGKDLVILRIDNPRTTVVRISNIQSVPLKKIHSIYKPLGVVLGSFIRTPDAVDVHFGLSEWPNMLNMLNRLNGYEVEGRRLQAEPAPVFPPEVLLALWHEPEERKYLKSVAESLLHKLGEKDTFRLASLKNALSDLI